MPIMRLVKTHVQWLTDITLLSCAPSQLEQASNFHDVINPSTNMASAYQYG